MANMLYDKGRNHFAQGNILWKATGGSTIRCFLLDAADYTPSLTTHEFLSSVPTAARIGGVGGGTGYNQGALLTLIDPVAGVCDANDVTMSTVTGDPAEYILIYRQVTSDADSLLIALLDGKAQVEIAADALTSATTVIPEDLLGAAANGAVFTKISGTGPATFTLSSSASEGARSLAVNAIGSAITAGAVYEYPVVGSGLPVTPNGGDIAIVWSDGANKIFKL